MGQKMMRDDSENIMKNVGGHATELGIYLFCDGELLKYLTPGVHLA